VKTPLKAAAQPRATTRQKSARALKKGFPGADPSGAWGGTVRRILVVEDSGAMRALIGSALEGLDEKVEVDEAESGFAALRMLPRRSYDLIVTDINMPDINGLELVSFVKRDPRYRNTPLLIVSTEGSARDRDKGLELGASAYLVKPFAADDLRQLVLDLLDHGPSRRS